MTAKTDVTIDERLRRLERLALLGLTESHGLAAGVGGTSVQRLRAQCFEDARWIARELEQAPMESRAG